MKLIGAILLIFSYLYHFLLGLILTVIASLALASGQNNLNLAMLPWKGGQLTYWVLALGIGAIIFVLLAVTNLFRWLFPIWCLIVVWLMFWYALHRQWRTKTVAMIKVNVAAFIGLAIGLMLTFPPFMDLVQGK